MNKVKEILERIAAIDSTQKLTQAMSMVASAKLPKAYKKFQYIHTYTNKLTQMLHPIISAISDKELQMHPYCIPPSSKDKVLILSIGTNKGLCGNFNTLVIHQTLQYLKNTQPKNVHILPIGKKIIEYITKSGLPYLNHGFELKPGIDLNATKVLFETIMMDFKQKKYDTILLIYHQPKTMMLSETVVQQWLPIVVPDVEQTKPFYLDQYLYEPDHEKNQEFVVHHLLLFTLYKALLASISTEHSGRMLSMHKATDNAKTLLQDLRLTYNRTRQAHVTKELLEVVSGAEALRS